MKESLSGHPTCGIWGSIQVPPGTLHPLPLGISVKAAQRPAARVNSGTLNHGVLHIQQALMKSFPEGRSYTGALRTPERESSPHSFAHMKHDFYKDNSKFPNCFGGALCNNNHLGRTEIR